MTKNENERNVPELRFRGFTDAWEKRKLGELVTMIDGDRGSNYPHESDFRPEGETVFLDTGNVRPEEFNLSSRKYISAAKNQELRSGLLTEGDFVMTTRGTLGNVAYYGSDIQATYPKVRINSAMLILRPTGRVANGLLLSLLRGNLIATFLKKNHVGSAQPHITKRDFSKMLVSFPSDDIEQDKIGSFLRSLNDTIALHQRKHELLLKLKQGYLQKLFPKNGETEPELRFAGFTDAWEKRKLGELGIDISDGDWIESNHIFKNGDY
jgi:type I restriction enzyme S subunit